MGTESLCGRRAEETRGEQGRGRLHLREGGSFGSRERIIRMSWVLVVDQERHPLAPVHPGSARWLLSQLQAQRSEAGQGLSNRDIVRSTVTTGTKQGLYAGRVLVRASGFFDLRTNGAGCRASVIASARWCIAAMATVTRSECGMDRNHPPRPLQKERTIPPPICAHGGILARFW
jgi:hypothetical protein